jgi:hypothetical protein
MGNGKPQRCLESEVLSHDRFSSDMNNKRAAVFAARVISSVTKHRAQSLCAVGNMRDLTVTGITSVMPRHSPMSI